MIFALRPRVRVGVRVRVRVRVKVRVRVRGLASFVPGCPRVYRSAWPRQLGLVPR